MTKLKLPCLVVHRGKVYQLNETRRKGLILQAADQDKIAVDNTRGECCILTINKRVALRSLKGSVAQPGR
jgi:hypothetical protein